MTVARASAPAPVLVPPVSATPGASVPGAPGPRARRWTAGLVAIGVATALVAGSVSYALWSGSADAAGGTVTAGDLSLTLGTATWQQVTPGVTDGASGVLTPTAPDFLSMPGDVIEIVQPVTTTLVGDNLAAGLHVDFADAETGNADVDAGLIAVSFHIEDADGNQIAPATGQADLGDMVPVPGLVGNDAGAIDDWSIVVTVDVLGDYVWETAEPRTAADRWAIGALVVELEQVRYGDGYSGSP